MRLTGLVYGRRMGNCEILVKEAMMSAEETAGAEVELIRLSDLNIQPCTGCEACLKRGQGGGEPECVIKGDDMVWLMEAVAKSDGVIIATAVYFLGPAGPFKTISDRMLPYSAKTLRATKANAAAGKDIRKVGGLISVGGGPHHWAAMGVTLMHRFTSPLMISVVDKLHLVETPGKGQVLLNEKALQQARRMGRNVAQSVGKLATEVTYLGEDPGLCPVCHSNLVYPGRRFSAECPICGAGGTLIVDGKTITMRLDEESMHECHLTIEGRDFHLREIIEHQKQHLQNLEKISKMAEKYKAYKSFSRPEGTE